MKKMKSLLMIAVLIICIGPMSLFSQDVPPPPPGGGHGAATNQEGGRGAPIGGGLFILLAMGSGYGAYKIYQKKKKSLLD